MDEPQVSLNFDRAWNHLNEFERMKWRETVNKELKAWKTEKFIKSSKEQKCQKIEPV